MNINLEKTSKIEMKKKVRKNKQANKRFFLNNFMLPSQEGKNSLEFWTHVTQEAVFLSRKGR